MPPDVSIVTTEGSTSLTIRGTAERSPVEFEPPELVDCDGGAGGDPVHADPNMSNPAANALVQAVMRRGAGAGTGTGAVPSAAAVLLILIGFPLLSLAAFLETGHRLSLLRHDRVRMAPGRLTTARICIRQINPGQLLCAWISRLSRHRSVLR